MISQAAPPSSSPDQCNGMKRSITPMFVMQVALGLSIFAGKPYEERAGKHGSVSHSCHCFARMSMMWMSLSRSEALLGISYNGTMMGTNARLEPSRVGKSCGGLKNFCNATLNKYQISDARFTQN
jgi:hypothetical protein